MPAATPAWLDSFTRAIAAGALDAALALLRAQSTTHAGTPPAAAKRAAVRAILSARPDAVAQLDTARACLAPGDDTATEVAIMLLPYGYTAAPRRCSLVSTTWPITPTGKCASL